MSENVRFEDLYDIERRPGAGLSLWTKSVEHQLARMHDVNYRLRLAHSTEGESASEDGLEWQLQMEVYFLVLSIRRLVLFHDLLARYISDPRLAEARETFTKKAPAALRLRNFYEHLDEYLLDGDKKHMKTIQGRAAPILKLRWDSDNVVVSFGDTQVDVSLAAQASIDLGRSSGQVYEAAMAQARDARSDDADLPSTDGTHMLEVVLGRSIEIGGRDEGRKVVSGTLLDVRVREMTPTEAAAHRANERAEAGAIVSGLGTRSIDPNGPASGEVEPIRDAAPQ